MDERRFVVWDADGRPHGAFADFDAAHQWAHLRMRQPRIRLPLTLDDRVAKVSRRVSYARCELVAWAEFAVLPGCDLPTLATSTDMSHPQPHVVHVCTNAPVTGHCAPVHALTDARDPE